MQPIMFIPALSRSLDGRSRKALAQVCRGDLLSASIGQSLVDGSLDERAHALTILKSALITEDINEVAQLLAISLQHDNDPNTITQAIDILLSLVCSDQSPQNRGRLGRLWYGFKFHARKKKLQKIASLHQALLELSSSKDTTIDIQRAALRGLSALN